MKSSNRTKAFFSIKDVAETLGVNERTVRRWIKAGHMSGHRVGRQWRISKKDIEEFLAANYHGAVRDVL